MDVVTHCVPRRARVSLKSAEGTASQVRHSEDLTDRNREWRHGTGRIAAPSGGKKAGTMGKISALAQSTSGFGRHVTAHNGISIA